MIPLTPPLSAVAISQSTVSNNQVNLNDVFSGQTLNVVDVSDSTTATTAAGGNTVSSSVVSGSLDVQSSQVSGAPVGATSVVNVTTNAGAQTTVSTSATGNESDAGSFEGGGPLTGKFIQSSSTQNIAESTFNATSAQTGNGSMSVQAIGNTAGVTVQDTSANVTINQTSTAQTEADGAATLLYTPGTVVASAVAVSNDMSAVGTGNASQSLNVTQSMSGPLTQATQSFNVGNGQTVITSASASSNNISISNENGPLNVVDNQTNTSFTFAQAVGSSYEFGTGQAIASGVGNSVLAGNAGQQMSIDNTQANVGNGVVVNASFNGNNGFDASSSATAMGNAVTGYACSDCGGVVNVSNNQTNTAQVAATSTLGVTASNRSVNGTAVAVGNNATFYVSKPSH